MKKIIIETYGCAANQSRSEKLAWALSESGYALAESEKEADAIILNTCAVKKQTEQKIFERVKLLRRDFPEKKIILAGCLAEIPELLKKADYDAIVKKPEDVSHVLEKIFGGKSELAAIENILSRNVIRNNPLVDIEEIAEGCLGSCSYCIVRRAKGALKSEPPEKIIENIARAAKGGCREIWLTAQDTACYGFDTGYNLPELIGSICRINSDFSIRIGMMNPEHALKILPELIESYRNEKVYRFLHLPAQSGSDTVLEKMNRRYRAADFLRIVSGFRKALPRIQIWTDIIVGFPGETEEDFKKTLALVKEAKPDFANVSRFGPRPGTPAERMEQISGEIKKERSGRLSETLKRIYLENNKKWVGWEGKALVTERSRTGFLAKNLAYKPVQIKSEKNILGKTVNVKITKASSSTLFGEIIE